MTALFLENERLGGCRCGSRCARIDIPCEIASTLLETSEDAQLLVTWQPDFAAATPNVTSDATETLIENPIERNLNEATNGNV